MKMMEDSTYWEGKAPSSAVLGPFLAKVPSGVLGPASLVALMVVRHWVKACKGRAWLKV
jgi:hypothetical protein